MAKGVKGSSPSTDDKPVKTSFMINPVLMKKVRYISLMEEKDITDLVDEGLKHVVQQYEKKNGEIPVR